MERYRWRGNVVEIHYDSEPDLDNANGGRVLELHVIPKIFIA